MLFNRKYQNVFTSLLKELNVKHTLSFSDTFFNEHPHKTDLFGISKMLSDYGITNAGIRMNEQEKDIRQIEAPFIAYFGGEFITVNHVSADRVDYLREGKQMAVPIELFNNTWGGVALLAETDENSIEPNYSLNKKNELISTLRDTLLLVLICLLLAYFFVAGHLYTNLPLILILLANLVGGYASYMLVQKQMRIQSTFADKICTLFKKSDCNNILESSAAKIWGDIGWSEVGLGYFVSNILLILLMPQLFPYLALINICALPYTLWSVWYQKVKAQQWCTLCLIVQFSLWAIFILNATFHLIQWPAFTIEELLLTGCFYGIPFLALSLWVPTLSKVGKFEAITQEINSIKGSEEIFAALLKQEAHYDVDKSTSKILWGNPDSELLITVLTNPHCQPCANLHPRIEALLKQAGDHLCVQYIFSSFAGQLDISNKYLISAYKNYDQKTAQTILNEWFNSGKHTKEEFAKKYNLTIDEAVEQEFLSHKNWKETHRLALTPTILVNGYKLPINYKIEDLRYFSKLD